jgi:hypothetical protein
MDEQHLNRHGSPDEQETTHLVSEEQKPNLVMTGPHPYQSSNNSPQIHYQYNDLGSRMGPSFLWSKTRDNDTHYERRSEVRRAFFQEQCPLLSACHTRYGFSPYIVAGFSLFVVEHFVLLVTVHGEASSVAWPRKSSTLGSNNTPHPSNIKQRRLMHNEAHAAPLSPQLGPVGLSRAHDYLSRSFLPPPPPFFSWDG